MAAQQGRDPRMLSQAEHQRYWVGPNTNRTLDKKADSGWEKECKKLRNLGIAEEELKKYYRSVESPIPNVNKLNDEIIDKVNGIASVRRNYFLLSVKRAGKKELNNLGKSMVVLKRDIMEAQHKINDLGGVCEKNPSLFSRPVNVNV